MADIRLDHVAFGLPEVAPAAELLVGTLGGREGLAGPGAGFHFWQWEFAGGGTIEIIVPDGPPDGFLHRFLAARGSGPHHLTFKVPDIRRTLARARELGYEPVGFNDAFPGWIEAFLHPKQAQGIVVQLVEHHPELDSEPNPDDWGSPQPFPATAAPAKAARVLGVRLSARDEASARRQWEALLGGSCERANSLLVIRWPDSPLRLAIRVDADAPEGPTALEISAPRRVALPEGPHSALGLPLVQVALERE